MSGAGYLESKLGDGLPKKLTRLTQRLAFSAGVLVCLSFWLAPICEYGPGPVAKKGFLLQYTFRSGCRRERRSHGKLFCGSEASMILDRSGYTITPDIGKPRKEESVGNAFRGENGPIESLSAHGKCF